MDTLDNRQSHIAPGLLGDEMSLGSLLSLLSDHEAKPLIFHYDGKFVRAGYHLTEVKTGNFSALDCGANFESWTEIFVQLWDVNEGEGQHMSTGKFSAIIGKVTEAVGLDHDAKLTFEVSDGVQPIQLYRAVAPRIEVDGVYVELSPRPSSCKPRDGWLDTGLASAGCGADASVDIGRP